MVFIWNKSKNILLIEATELTTTETETLCAMTIFLLHHISYLKVTHHSKKKCEWKLRGSSNINLFTLVACNILLLPSISLFYVLYLLSTVKIIFTKFCHLHLPVKPSCTYSYMENLKMKNKGRPVREAILVKERWKRYFLNFLTFNVPIY